MSNWGLFCTLTLLSVHLNLYCVFDKYCRILRCKKVAGYDFFYSHI